MIDSRVEQDADFVMAALTAAVDDLLALRLDPVSGLGLIELARLVEVQVRRLPAFDHALIAALNDRAVAAEVGARNTAAVLVAALRVSPAQASSRVQAGKELGPRVDFTGAPMPPLYPAVARAQADGVISPAHARVITATVRELPAAAQGEHAEPLEGSCSTRPATTPPDHLARIARHAGAVIDPDGTLTGEEDHRRARGLSIVGNTDGSATIRGRLTPECAAVAYAVLDSLAKPAPTDAETPDSRSAAQRGHDALLDAGQRLLRSATLPDCGGIPATVLVTITLDQLETRLGVATTTHGGTLTVPAALRLAADGDVIPVVLGDGGGILAHGRTTRHATRRQRRALTARDGGCSFPACDAPPDWCHTHHIRPWEDGGPTDLDNLTLVCGFHHREHQRLGWQCHMTGGAPHWRPPRWIDPHRTPRRNTSHHIARYLLPDAA